MADQKNLPPKSAGQKENEGLQLPSKVGMFLVSVGFTLETLRKVTADQKNIQLKNAGQKENEGLRLPSKIGGCIVSAGFTIQALWQKLENVLAEEKGWLDVDELLRKSSPKGKLIDFRWIVGDLLGEGSYGAVYSAKDVMNGEEVAVKMELRNDRADLHRENTIYHILHKYSKYKRPIGVPRIKFFGTLQDRNVLVMDRLGMSLQESLKSDGLFTGRDVLSVGIHALYRIQALHQIGYIHRDIKPGNMLRGREDPQTLYLIDFGLAKRYLLPDGVTHTKCRKVSGVIGTPPYASINTHCGIEQSRRDDLESLGYVLVSLCRGSLPWQLIRSQRQDKLRQEMGQFKTNYPLRDLCKFMPVQVFEYLRYVRSLAFEENPDYIWMRALLRSGLQAIDRGDEA